MVRIGSGIQHRYRDPLSLVRREPGLIGGDLPQVPLPNGKALCSTLIRLTARVIRRHEVEVLVWRDPLNQDIPVGSCNARAAFQLGSGVVAQTDSQCHPDFRERPRERTSQGGDAIGEVFRDACVHDEEMVIRGFEIRSFGEAWRSYVRQADWVIGASDNQQREGCEAC